MNPRVLVVVLVVLALVAVAYHRMGPEPDDPQPAPATVEAALPAEAEGDTGPRTADPDARGEQEPDEEQAPPETIAFDALPAEHAPDAVLPKVSVVGASLQHQFPHANVEMLEAECTSAPCILGFDYDAAAVAAAEGGARPFHQAVRATFEAELGYPVTSMHIDEVEGGKQIWMFAVPPEVDKADSLRNRLIETGHHRHAALTEAAAGVP